MGVLHGNEDMEIRYLLVIEGGYGDLISTWRSLIV